MCLKDQKYKIYPSNWLMRAGIIGFLRILNDNSEKKDDNNNFDCFIPKDLTEKNKLKGFLQKFRRYASDKKIPLKTFYNNSILANNVPKKNNIEDYDKLVDLLLDLTQDNEIRCSFCNERKAIRRNGKFVILDEMHFTPLGASIDTLTNFFWEGKPNLFLCFPCELIIYCAAFGFTKFNGKYYFIDVPASIKEIKEVNDIWADYFSSNDKEKSIKNSLIEILKKSENIKAKWSLNNISIIEIDPIIDNTSNIYNYSLSPEIAYAIRRRIQSYPSTLKNIYDIFIDYLYSKKPLYEMISYIVYGYISKEKLRSVGEKKLSKFQNGRLILEGMKLKRANDLLFFIKFQKEVEDYGNYR